MTTKPAITYKEQVEKLCSKGLLIVDKNECRKFLEKVNYYRFSAYFLPFKHRDCTYEPGLTFERVRKIYEFDAELRSLIAKQIEGIELFLRTQFAYYFAHNYGPTGYLDPMNFSTTHNHDLFEKRIRNCINENSRTPIVIHHQEKYDGVFPIWVIIGFFP